MSIDCMLEVLPTGEGKIIKFGRFGVLVEIENKRIWFPKHLFDESEENKLENVKSNA